MTGNWLGIGVMFLDEELSKKLFSLFLVSFGWFPFNANHN